MYKENGKGIDLPLYPQLFEMEQLHEQQQQEKLPIGVIPVVQNGTSNPNPNLDVAPVPVLSHGRHSAWRQLTLGAIIFKIIGSVILFVLSLALFTHAPEAPEEPIQNPKNPGTEETTHVFVSLYLSLAKTVCGLMLGYSTVSIFTYYIILYGIVQEILSLTFFWIVVLSIDIMGNVCGILISWILDELFPKFTEANVGTCLMGFFFLSLGLLVLNLLFLVWAKSFCKEVFLNNLFVVKGKSFMKTRMFI